MASQSAMAGTVLGKVINFHDASQGYSAYTTNNVYNGLFVGQGALSDPGNNIWNGFGHYGGPGSTAFYGAGHPDCIVHPGNPGNPYAWVSGTSASGTNLFSPSNPGASNVGNAYSDGTISPITFSTDYTNDNGGVGPATQGSPNWITSVAALAAGTTQNFTLSGVPAGSYDLYLYGANYDNTRGAAFTVSSGTPVQGITSAINSNTGGNVNNFTLGQDYVEYINVTPVNGVISGTWSGVTNPSSGLSGEGDFNGLQLAQIITTGATYVYYGYDSLTSTSSPDNTFGGTGTNFNNSGVASAFSNGSLGSIAVFDDTAPGSHTIAIVSGGVSPFITQFNNSATTYTITGGPISGPGSVTLNGTGTVTFNNSNSYTGATLINSGILVLNPGSSLATSSITVASGATLNVPTGGTMGKLTSSTLAVADVGTINLGGSFNLGALSGGGTVNVNTSGATLTLTGGSFFGTLSANALNLNLTGAGGSFTAPYSDGSSPNSLTVNSTGVWTLGAANSYSGGTTLTAGSVLGGANGFGTGPVVLHGGAIGGTINNTAVISANVSGSTLIVANGGGALELSGSNSYTGPISIQGNTGTGTTATLGGTLKIDSPGALGSATAISVANGGTFEDNDTNGTLGTSAIHLTITGAGNGSNGALRGPDNATGTWAGGVNISGQSTISPGIGGTFILTGALTGTGPVLFAANSADTGSSAPTSTLTLTPATPTTNTYTGESQVTGEASALGALAVTLGANNGFSSAAGLNFVYGPNNGATIDLAGFNQSVQYLSGSSNSAYLITSTGTSSTLTVTSGLRAGTPAYLATTLSGNISLVMNDPTGLGNQIIAGTNTYTGPTTITKGTLTAASSSALSSGPVLLNGGTLGLAAPGNPIAGTPIITAGAYNSASVTLTNGAGPAPQFSGGTLTVTFNGYGGTLNSAFYNTKVPVSDTLGFTANFTWNVVSGNADGIAFVLQNDPRGLSAIGSGGGNSLGYVGISNSAAALFEIYPGGANGLAFGSGGRLGSYNSAPSLLVDQSFNVSLVYNGPTQTLTETVVGGTDGSTTTEVYSGIDYSMLVGGPASGSTTAYVGFTGATGGASATQTISNFTYAQNTATTTGTTPVSISNVISAAAGTISGIQIGVSSATNTSATIGGLNIASGATVNVSRTTGATVRGVLFTPSLSIASSGSTFLGKLDIGNNDLVITSGTTITQATALVASGYNNGQWTGNGITSRAAANASAGHLTALGVIVNDNGSGQPLYGTGGAISTTLDGSNPADGNILVKYTYYGDANLDGAVDGSDYSLIDNAFTYNKTHLSSPLSGWYNGDFNYDGVINGSDYTLIDNAFNSQGASLGSNPLAQVASQVATSAVPEPATMSLLVIGATTLLSRRKRRI